MRIRQTIVSGQFYPDRPEACRGAVRRLLSDNRDGGESLPQRLIGGIVPHAGWAFSGEVAGAVFGALKAQALPSVVVLFGGVHQYQGRDAAVFASGRWETPIGDAVVDGRLAQRLLGQTNLIADDAYAHESEHSLEVQIPFCVEAFPEAKIVPIMVPSSPRAGDVGDAVGRTLTAYNYDAVIVGTTDLTHYGPYYGFTPKGVGQEANDWAKAENDVRFLELVTGLEGEAVVEEAMTHRNACSSGAVAATIAAVKQLGATRGTLLAHTSSGEVMVREQGQTAEDSVGYAGIVFG